MQERVQTLETSLASLQADGNCKADPSLKKPVISWETQEEDFLWSPKIQAGQPKKANPSRSTGLMFSRTQHSRDAAQLVGIAVRCPSCAHFNPNHYLSKDSYLQA